MEDTKIVVDCTTGAITEVPLTPEDEAERAALAEADATRRLSANLETNEDAERLRIIADRAAVDPAFAALADVTLRGRPL